MKVKYLIFGAGYLGKKFADYLENSKLSLFRIKDLDSLIEEINKYDPEIIINCVGKTGTPHIDWCEDNKEITFFSNVTIPKLLLEASKKLGKYLVHLGSGCIYDGENLGKGFSEEDAPNFFGSYYSRTKIMAENVLKGSDNVLIVRIRMPIDNEPHQRNLLDKLLKYKKIISLPNSITVISDMLRTVKELMDKKAKGIFNVVNTEVVTNNEILKIFSEISKRDLNYEVISIKEFMKLVKVPRSNCLLSTKKLDNLNIQVPDVRESLKNCISKYAENLKINKKIPEMKGVLLAGGTGSRLAPLNRVTNKHLLPIYNKPMIYYPLQTLKNIGVKEVLIVSGKEHAGRIFDILGSGREFDLKLSYEQQDEAGGIAQALGLAENFSDGQNIAVILGDNIFEEDIDISNFDEGARIFLKRVDDPQRFGVATLEGDKVVNIEEKPKNPKTNYAVTGIYLYDNKVFNYIKNLRPSARGELEITDVNNFYIQDRKMDARMVEGFWTDAGTFESLLNASNLVRNAELNSVASKNTFPNQ